MAPVSQTKFAIKLTEIKEEIKELDSPIKDFTIQKCQKTRKALMIDAET